MLTEGFINAERLVATLGLHWWAQFVCKLTQLVASWLYAGHVREGCWVVCHFGVNHRPPTTSSMFRMNCCFRSVRFWLDLCKYLVWFSGYLDSNRFGIFTDLSQLRAALSQTDYSLNPFKCKLIRNSQQTDSVLLGLHRLIVTLKMATYCERPRTWFLSLKRPFHRKFIAHGCNIFNHCFP